MKGGMGFMRFRVVKDYCIPKYFMVSTGRVDEEACDYISISACVNRILQDSIGLRWDSKATEHKCGKVQGPGAAELRVFVVYGHAIDARDGVEPILQRVQTSPIIVQGSESFIDADTGFQVAVRGLLGL